MPDWHLKERAIDQFGIQRVHGNRVPWPALHRIGSLIEHRAWRSHRQRQALEQCATPDERDGKKWRRRLKAGDLLSKGVEDQPHQIVDVQPFHHLGAVGLDGLRADAQDPGDSLDAASLGKELQDFVLTRS